MEHGAHKALPKVSTCKIRSVAVCDEVLRQMERENVDAEATNLKSDATSVGATNGDVEEDLRVGGGRRVVSGQLGLGGTLRSNGGTRAARGELSSLVAGTSEHDVDCTRPQNELNKIVWGGWSPTFKKGIECH